jgi:hypothetical protein
MSFKHSLTYFINAILLGKEPSLGDVIDCNDEPYKTITINAKANYKKVRK